MEELDRVTLKDGILNQLHEFGVKSKTQISGQYIGNYSADNFENVLEELLETGYIETTSLTKDSHRLKITFRGIKILESGGFVGDRENHLEANAKMWEMETIDGRIKEKQLENLELSNRLSKQKLKTHLIPILISLVGLGVATASFFRPANTVPNEETNTKIESIEKELEELRMDYKEKNKELKDKLYKADMLISIYESGRENKDE